MPKPRILAVTLLLVLSVVLAACGSDNSDDPTPVPAATRSPVLPTDVPGTTGAGEVQATPTARATTTTLVATPAVAVQPTATTAVVHATPAVVATATATAGASPVVASPVAPVSTPVHVMLVLNGTEQVDYVLTQEGCVGLGQWRSLRPGAQVVVRDAGGTVADIATLEPGDGGCSWVADIDAPDSAYVSISIPMVTEVWYTRADIQAGEIELLLP